jgi:hypothetical protein
LTSKVAWGSLPPLATARWWAKEDDRMLPAARTTIFRFVGVLVLAGALAGARTASAAPFEVGDIFAAVGDSNLDGVSEVRRYNAAGVLQETLNLTGASNLSTGMVFDSAGTSTRPRSTPTW